MTSKSSILKTSNGLGTDPGGTLLATHLQMKPYGPVDITIDTDLRIDLMVLEFKIVVALMDALLDTLRTEGVFYFKARVLI